MLLFHVEEALLLFALRRFVLLGAVALRSFFKTEVCSLRNFLIFDACCFIKDLILRVNVATFLSANFSLRLAAFSILSALAFMLLVVLLREPILRDFTLREDFNVRFLVAIIITPKLSPKVRIKNIAHTNSESTRISLKFARSVQNHANNCITRCFLMHI